MLTQPANELIHNDKKRMPCLLTRGQEQGYLNPSSQQKEGLELLSEQYHAQELRAHSISKLITSRTESAAVLEPYTYPGLKDF